jgi:hypothetical protein
LVSKRAFVLARHVVKGDWEPPLGGSGTRGSGDGAFGRQCGRVGAKGSEDESRLPLPVVW